MENAKMLKCPACGEYTLHPKRKELGYHVCISCSTTEAVVGITTVEGTGDHTYNDIIIMDKRKAVAIAKREAELSGKSSHTSLELLDLDKDEDKLNEKVTSKMQAIMDEDINSETIITNDNHPNEDVDTDGMIKGIDY
tara:strand:- start:440 stop:853 length:414 start_codon:yes stop_codon:yes gene_type:complete